MTYLTFDELVSFKKFVVALHFTVTINSKTCLYLNGIYNNSYDTYYIDSVKLRLNLFEYKTSGFILLVKVFKTPYLCELYMN